MLRCSTLALGVSLVFAVCLPSVADQKGKPATASPSDKQDAKKPATKDVEVKGTFEASKTFEVSIEPGAWTSLTTLRAVQHGASVKKGQPILWFKTDKLDEQIKAAENALVLSTLALKQSELDLKTSEAKHPISLVAAKKAKATTDESLAYFMTTTLPRLKIATKDSLDRAKFSLEYATEELEQLEKMYKADDLTEETEEIILKRARRGVESRKESLESAKIAYERTLSYELPRQQDGLVTAAKSGGIDYNHTRATSALTLAKKRLDHEKVTQDRKKGAEQLAKLKKDRRLAVIKAPMDGIAYYGSVTRAKWSDKAKIDPQLRQGGTVTPKQTVITIVSPKSLLVRVDLAEKDLHQIRPGVAGVATPTGFPGSSLNVKVVRVSRIPIAADIYDCVLRVESTDRSPVLPGMTCKVKLQAPVKKGK